MSNIYVARPRYGLVEREHETSMFVCSKEHKIYLGDQPGSATPSEFNKEWCKCLNSPEPYDYFLMVHADVAPLKTEEPWLDVLVREAVGYDVMHAFCCLKDGSGKTSTLIASSLDPFVEPARRVTLKELDRLPPTFDADTYGEKLDVPWAKYMGCNTGCMLVDVKYNLDRLRRFPGFSWLTLIMGPKKGTDLYVPLDQPEVDPYGTLRPFFWPEDWQFAMWCQRNGMRVGGTRKVVTNHYGTAFFSTHPAHTTGVEHDDGRF